jgi:oligoribonuclease (3'-5' exoribonuclease)
LAKAKYLTWIDLETSGLGEYSHPILEVGMILTKADAPFEELETYEAVVLPDEAKFSTWRSQMNTTVTRMHTKNGLLSDLGTSVAKPIEQVQSEMVAVIAPYGRQHTFMLAGSGVGHFDRKFIDAQLPEFSKWLQYPCLDVGVWRRGIEFAGRPDLVTFGETFTSQGKPHRGLADVQDHLNEWRSYAALIGSTNEGAH